MRSFILDSGVFHSLPWRPLTIVPSLDSTSQYLNPLRVFRDRTWSTHMLTYILGKRAGIPRENERTGQSYATSK